VTGHPWIRPYLLTGGRTRTRHQLFLHTLVSAGRDGPAAPPGLTPEAGRLYARARLGTQSVAELSAHCGMPLGVTRVLLEDMAATDHVLINEDTYTSPYDHRLLKRVIDGLREFA